jgi:hypothetical protein
MYWAWIGFQYLFQINASENAEESGLAIIVFLDIIQPSFILFKIRRFRGLDSQLGVAISIGSKWRLLPEDGDRIQSMKRCVLSKIQDVG